MADLIGFNAIAFVAFITIIIALRLPSIASILFVAFTVRFFTIIIGHYIFDLPDSSADALNFEKQAWDIGQHGFFNVLWNFHGPDSRFISWLIAIVYSFFGRSLLMAQSISLFFGIGCVVLGWKLGHVLWDNHTAKKIGWTIALFPSLVLYSVSFLREVYVCFFLLVAIYGVVNWTKNEDFKSIIIAMIGFIGAAFFHGAMLIGAITFIAIIFITSFNNVFGLLKYNFINPKKFILLFFCTIILGLYLLNFINVQYLGTFEKTTNLENLLYKTEVSTKGVASFPEWTVINSPIELIYKSPIRAIYFIFSPFPWDVKKIQHLIGIFDSILYLYLSILIFRNRAVIWRDKALRYILIILAFYIIVFGIGVGNFGTAIRHRSKFVIIIILLAGPLIKRLVFNKSGSKV